MSRLNKIISDLKRNPIEINHDEIFYKGKQPFQLEIIVKKLHKRCDKPTHTTTRGLIRSMKKIRGEWLRADNPSNIPQLHGFIAYIDEEHIKNFTIDAAVLHKEKIKPEEIIKRATMY